MADVHGAGGELERHGGGHGGQHAGFDAAAQAIGKHGDDAAFLLDRLGEKHVSRDELPVLGPLAVIHLDEAGLLARHCGCSSTSSGLNERTMELRMISESAAFSPSR